MTQGFILEHECGVIRCIINSIQPGLFLVLMSQVGGGVR